jgi:hypothetical protein
MAEQKLESNTIRKMECNQHFKSNKDKIKRTKQSHELKILKKKHINANLIDMESHALQ